MKNRELTYYSLSPRQDLLNKFYTADTMDSQGFKDLGFDEKWRHHLWISHNNISFLGFIGNQVDLKRMDAILNEQLNLYERKRIEGFDEDLLRINEARKDWLKHTKFICRNEYNDTKNEIFKKAVKWCKKRKNKWLKETDKNIRIKKKAKLNKEQNNTLNKGSILNEQNKLIPKVSIEEVYCHFEVLTKTTNRDDEFYLTNNQLLIFIKSTFINRKPIKQDFDCKGFQKKKVRRIFYDFYFKNKNKETNQTSLKRKYFNIMNDAFNGFNENDYTDFAK